MGRNPRKCKHQEEIAVVGGVRTRAMALAMAAEAVASSTSTAAKRIRKVGNGELKFASTYVELRSRRRVVIAPKDSISTAASASPVEETNCSSGVSDHTPSSCCSSNASSELRQDPFAIIDPEGDIAELETTMHSDCRERRETMWPSKKNSRLRMTVQKPPSEFEIEEFFSAAEKDLQKRFTEKYNFDIVRDVPLEEGRYQWIPVSAYKFQSATTAIGTANSSLSSCFLVGSITVRNFNNFLV
ncbi:hypothetical protein Nepgr_016615 [Nepenthes gracilis]|uniref:Cyclin-dependent kinase inhibitor domain-containing protein n=1 Tax=Nepenthes gracilis TaxID=150966 RepID=A0AAD3XSA2_NEPGR|nr:hypothetical protein Nepgr_016615 [Nepenthes gracilis]